MLSSFGGRLDKVVLDEALPCSEIERLYTVGLYNGKLGAGNEPVRMIIRALITKHTMIRREMILAIQDSSYKNSG